MDIEAVRAIFASMPIDVIAALLFASAIAVLTLRMGASLAIAFSLSFIISNMLFGLLPTTYMVGAMLAGQASSHMDGGIFLGIVVVVTLLLYRMMSSLMDDSARPLFAILTGLATVIIVLALWHITPLQTFWTLNTRIQGVFGEAYRLFWILVAFISFAFVKS